MIKSLFIAFSIILATAATALAQGDSITTGVRAVEGFYTEMTRIVGDRATAEAADAFGRDSVDRANSTSAEILAMRWKETPGTRRYNRVRDLLELYMDAEIMAAGEIISGEDAMNRMAELKIRQLKMLGESVRFETYRPPPRKPVPGVDPVPHEENRDEGQGLYFR